MTPPTWLDAAGRRRSDSPAGPVAARSRRCGSGPSDLRPHGWKPPQTLHIPDWCGCTTEYIPVPAGDGWWQLVPIWEPEQTVNPLRRYGPPEAR